MESALLDISDDRILRSPRPGTATEDAMLLLLERDKVFCELVAGTLVEKPTAWYTSCLAVVLASKLIDYSLEHGNRAVVCGPDCPFRLHPGLVRLANVSYTLRERITPSADRDPIASWAPNLAVEFLDDQRTRREMDRKLREYFDAGVQLVWYVDPRTQTAKTYRSPEDFDEIDEAGSLDGGDVLPGFTLPLATLFQRAK